jgi:hypothetical protein
MADHVNSIQDSINQLTKALKPAQEFQKRMESLFGPGGNLAKSIADMDQRNKELASILVNQGVIKNTEAVRNLFYQSYISPGTSILEQIKRNDILIEFRKSIDYLKEATIPYSSLYSNIFKAIPYETIKKFHDAALLIDDDDEIEEDGVDDVKIDIKRPQFLEAAMKIEIYVNLTENHIYTNGTEKEKALWEKCIKIVLNAVKAIFMAWALSNTPINQFHLFQDIEKVVQVIDHYEKEHGPIQDQIQQNQEQKLDFSSDTKEDM